MRNTLPALPTRRVSPAAVVVPRQQHARAALAAAEQVTALKRLKRSIYAGMSLAEVRSTIDAHIADVEATLTQKVAA